MVVSVVIFVTIYQVFSLIFRFLQIFHFSTNSTQFPPKETETLPARDIDVDISTLKTHCGGRGSSNALATCSS
jgi:hypothetical protein